MLGLAKWLTFAAAMFAVHEALTWAVPRAPWLTAGGFVVVSVGLALWIDPRSRQRSEIVYALKLGAVLGMIFLFAFLYDAWNGR